MAREFKIEIKQAGVTTCEAYIHTDDTCEVIFHNNIESLKYITDRTYLMNYLAKFLRLYTVTELIVNKVV